MRQLNPQQDSRYRHWKSYLFLLFLALLAYWPVSLQLFSVKNDAIHYFLPVRYMISSSIQHGFFPYWVNSFYLGYPIHGDMQSGVWNPFVQLISLFTTYNVTVLHIEYLLYIFLAGAGMYKLSGIVTPSRLVRITVASAYMLSGYMLGSGQFINWLASAAFVPFLFFYSYRFLHSPTIANALKTALSLWLLFVCGYPADSIIVFYILGIVWILYFLQHGARIIKDKTLLRKYLVNHLLLIIATLLLLAPAVISYFELLPYYSRGGGVGVAAAMENSFDSRNAISFVSPWSVITNDFVSKSDPTSRSIFIGLYTLIFAAASFFGKSSRRKIVLQVAVITSFLFCLGDATPLRKIAYDLLPGMNTFRHPSHFRLYTILALLLLAAIVFDELLKKERRTEKIIRITSLSLIAVIFFLVCSHLSIGGLGKIFRLVSVISNREQLKIALGEITWKDMLLVSCIMQLAFLAVFIFMISKRNVFAKKSFLVFHILNLVVNSVLVLPAIFVSKSSPAYINSLINEKRSFYNPSSYNRSLRENTTGAFDHIDELGLSYFYSQQPGISKITNSPAFLATMDSFVQTDKLYNYISDKPVAWLSNQTLAPGDSARLTDTASNCIYSFSKNVNSTPINSCDSFAGKVIITKVAPGRFSMTVTTSSACRLNLSQAYNHHWKATINGEPATIEKANIAFMSVGLPKGSFEVSWHYKVAFISYAFIVTLFTLLFIIVFLIVRHTRPMSD